FSMNGVRLGQGRENAKQYFEEHPEEAEELHQKIVEAIAADHSKLAAKRKKKGKDDDEADSAADMPEEETAAAPRDEKKPAAKSRAVSIDADDFDEDDGIDV